MKFDVLTDIMIDKNVTQHDLARMLKKSFPYINARINGHKSFTLDDVYSIADILGIHEHLLYYIFFDRRKRKKKRTISEIIAEHE